MVLLILTRLDIETEYWEESDAEIAEDLEPPRNLDTTEDELNPEQTSLIWWIMLFVSLFQTLHVIPQRAIGWLLCFFAALLQYLGKYSDFIQKVSAAFPSSVYLMDKYMGKDDSLNTFHKFVACPKCHSLYKYEETFVKRGSQYVIKTCHSMQKSHRVCGMPLLKRVVSRSGGPQVYPHLIYCCNDIIPTLKKLFRRKGFYDLCESTRSSGAVDSMSDVFHGRLWNEFDSSMPAFLSQKNHYGLFLNVDWYQPYKDRKYAVGVIYLVILNLPREVRYKRENVILAGLIPGPKEPPLTVNSYITSLVSELLRLWDGINVTIEDNQLKLIQCALVSVGCDLPAGRKLCGFLSHSANLGCSRCYAEFSRGFGCQDYSGFDRTTWELRTNQKHRKNVATILKCSTKTAQEEKESTFGCRYSALLKLPYFDPVKMLSIDPMHNLYLGTANYMMRKVWMNEGYLDEKKVGIIEDRLRSINVPPTVSFGRLPSCIHSGTKLTAEQWKNWVNYFSVFCLHGLLPPDHIECWRHFVLASRLLCKPTLSNDDVTLADALLLRFCQRFECLYGPELVTPNMHMHGHLADCIRDYGPLSSFWLFPFERYNGLLGQTPTNNRSIEVQIMRRFLLDTHYISLLQGSDGKMCDTFRDAVITHAETFQSTSNYCGKFKSALKHPPIIMASGLQIIAAPKYTIGVLSQLEVEVIKNLYSKLYAEDLADGDIEVPVTFQKVNFVFFEGQKLEAKGYFLAENVFPFTTSLREPIAGLVCQRVQTLRPVQIQYFAIHRLIRDESSAVIVLAAVLWPQPHPERFCIGKPVELWSLDLFETASKNRFIPVERLSSPLLTSESKVNNEHLLVTIPVHS